MIRNCNCICCLKDCIINCEHVVTDASIAQWQSTGLVNQGSWVRISLEALVFPCSYPACPPNRRSSHVGCDIAMTFLSKATSYRYITLRLLFVISFFWQAAFLPRQSLVVSYVVPPVRRVRPPSTGSPLINGLLSSVQISALQLQVKQ